MASCASHTNWPQWPMRARAKAQRGPANPNPRGASLGAKAPAAGPRGRLGAHPLASYIRRTKGPTAAPCCRRASFSSSLVVAWRSPAQSPPYPPPQRRRADDLASLSTTSCGIEIMESSSSRTYGSLGGVARATHRIIHLHTTRQV